MNAKIFWPKDQSADCPPLNPPLVAEAERILGVRLPAEYLDLLRLRNGGETSGYVFPTLQPTSWAPDHVPLESLFGIEVSPVRETSLPGVWKAWAAWGLPARLVPLCGDGHWCIALDYRKGPTPAVAWIDTECQKELVLAPDFAAFLTGLRPAADVDEEAGVLRENVGRFTGDDADDAGPGAGEDYICPVCGEEVPGSFGGCWKCETPRPG